MVEWSAGYLNGLLCSRQPDAQPTCPACPGPVLDACPWSLELRATPATPPPRQAASRRVASSNTTQVHSTLYDHHLTIPHHRHLFSLLSLLPPATPFPRPFPPNRPPSTPVALRLNSIHSLILDSSISCIPLRLLSPILLSRAGSSLHQPPFARLYPSTPLLQLPPSRHRSLTTIPLGGSP